MRRASHRRYLLNKSSTQQLLCNSLKALLGAGFSAGYQQNVNVFNIFGPNARKPLTVAAPRIHLLKSSLNQPTQNIYTMGLNKAELIENIAAEAKISKADAKRALDAFVSSTTKALKKGERVALVGFGTFSISKRAARKGRTHKRVRRSRSLPRRW